MNVIFFMFSLILKFQKNYILIVYNTTLRVTDINNICYYNMLSNYINVQV